MSDQKPTLAYWKIRGMAAGMQYLFRHLGVEYNFKTYESNYTNQVVDNSAWLNEKFTLGMSFPNLPYIVDGDYKITESSACYEYICAKWKPEYLGRDSAEKGKVQMLCGIIYSNLRNAITFTSYSNDRPRERILEAMDA